MANITLDKLKTIVQSIVASVTRYKPNLSVNDPDDPRYVAGRLCYKAKKTVEEVSETTVTFAENNGLYTAELTSVPGVQAIGDVRTVVWDGVAYVCKAGDYGGIGLALGNRSLYNAMVGESNPDTGEPFVWAMSPMFGISMLMTLDAAETHTVSCWADKEVVHTLPKEYLPQIPAEKLQGLAAVATSGSYNDLSDQPTIPTAPTDIVKYSAQRLTTGQKAQARANIGAGTSDFDGDADVLYGNIHAYNLPRFCYTEKSTYTLQDATLYETVTYNNKKYCKIGELKGGYYESVGFVALEMGNVSYPSGYTKKENNMVVRDNFYILTYMYGTLPDGFENNCLYIRYGFEYEEWDGITAKVYFINPEPEAIRVYKKQENGDHQEYRIFIDDSGTLSATAVTEEATE